MSFENEPTDKRHRSIFETMIFTQFPGIVDDLLDTTYTSDDEIRKLIEDRGYHLGEEAAVWTPPELENDLNDFDLVRYGVVGEEGKSVAAIGILKGDEEKLSKLRVIIDGWRETQTD